MSNWGSVLLCAILALLLVAMTALSWVGMFVIYSAIKNIFS